MILQLDQETMGALIDEANSLNLSVKTHIKNILKTHNNKMIIKEIPHNGKEETKQN